MPSTGPLRKTVLWLVVLAVVAAGGFYWWSKRNAKDSAPKYRTEKVELGPISETVTATGTLSAVTTVQVGSQVSGIVSRLYADFNSRVNKGQLVAELDPTPFQATLDQRGADLARTEVQARASQIAFDRQQRLLDQGLTSEAEYDAAKADRDGALAQVEQSRAAMRQAQANLNYTRILSPIEGVVVDRQYDVGQTVAASFQAPTLFTIAQDLTKMQVQADVDQADIGKIRTGQKANFTVDAYPEIRFEGEITQVRLNATVNQNVISYPVILTVPNPEERLRPKMTANVTIVVATASDVLRVPNAALRFRPVETGPPGSSKGGAATARPGPGAAAGSAGAEGRSAAPPAGGERPRDPDRTAAEFGQGARGIDAASGAFRASSGERPTRRQQTVYVLDATGAMKAVPVRTGISDGRHTAIVEGDLDAGDQVVVGMATVKVESTGTFPGAQPTGPGRGGGGGGRR